MTAVRLEEIETIRANEGAAGLGPAYVEWLIDRVKQLQKVADAVTAVRIATPENYQDAVLELDDALMDAGCFWVNGDVRETMNREVAERREQREQLRGLLQRLYEWDHMASAGDGPYWRGEIDKVLRQTIG